MNDTQAMDAGPMRPVYRTLSKAEQDKVNEIKDLGTALWRAFDEAGQSRELSLAKTKTEEAVMWAVKHVTG